MSVRVGIVMYSGRLGGRGGTGNVRIIRVRSLSIFLQLELGQFPEKEMRHLAFTIITLLGHEAYRHRIYVVIRENFPV